MSKWISVKDRLPEKSGSYLIVRNYREKIIDISHYTAHLIKTGFAGNYDNKITHWMPLPEAPNV